MTQLTINDIQRNLELNIEQATKIWNMARSKDNPKEVVTNASTIIGGHGTRTIKRPDGKLIFIYVETKHDDIKTLGYDYISREYLVTSVADWVTTHVSSFSCLNESEEEEENSNEEVNEDEPYILFYWDDGTYVAIQSDGMKDLIREKGMPIAHEIHASHCMEQ